jgi:hypothetical protein
MPARSLFGRTGAFVRVPTGIAYIFRLADLRGVEAFARLPRIETGKSAADVNCGLPPYRTRGAILAKGGC